MLVNKIKLLLAGAILLLFALLLCLFLYEHQQKIWLQKEKMRLLEKIRLESLKNKITENQTQETKILSPKPKSKIRTSHPDPCAICFQNYQYRLEVKDQKGFWIFQDENVFDQNPGQLTLTDKFWKEIKTDQSEQNNLPIPSSVPLKNRILIGFEPDQYKIEYAYSPLGIQTTKLNLNLSLYSSISFNYLSAPISARAGLGLELRF